MDCMFFYLYGCWKAGRSVAAYDCRVAVDILNSQTGVVFVGAVLACKEFSSRSTLGLSPVGIEQTQGQGREAMYFYWRFCFKKVLHYASCLVTANSESIGLLLFYSGKHKIDSAISGPFICDVMKVMV